MSLPQATEPHFDDLVKVIAHAQAEVVIVGGIAMILHGADYLTLDFDLCYRRHPDTIARLCDALSPYTPVLRSARLDIQAALLTQDTSLATDLGQVDLIGALTGIGGYEQAAALAVPVQIDDVSVLVLSLEGLIQTKEALRREKDRLHLLTLRALEGLKDE